MPKRKTPPAAPKAAAAQAKGSDARALELGFELAATPTALLDAEGRFLRLNGAAADLLGLNGTSPDGRSLLQCAREADRPVAAAAIAQLLVGDLDRTAFDLRLLRLDGTEIIGRASLACLTRDHGNATLLMLEVEDRTSLMRAHEALRASEERLALALDATSDGVWDLDVASGRLVVNAAWSQMLGYAPDEIPSRIEAWDALTHPDDAALAASQLDAHLAGEIPLVESEMRMRRKDGSWCWVLNRAKVVARDATGAPTRVVGTHADITVRRAQAEALASQARLFDTVLSNIPIAIDIVAPDGTIEYVNKACERLLGWTVEEMRSIDLLAAIYPDPEYRAKALASIVSGSPAWNDWQNRTRDGRTITVSWSNVHLPDGRVIGIGADVTAAREAESERERLERQLQQSQKLESLGVLAGGIAHDFNNLLVGMLGSASLAEETLPVDSLARPLVAEIRTTASRAADLTRQLLAYAGKGRFVVEPVDVSHLVEEMAALLRSAISKQAILEQDLARDPPRVEADATQLRQIVMNLITNASDALGDRPGTIRLRTGVVLPSPEFRRSAIGGEHLGAGAHVFIEVEDSGAGMTEATLARIFDPFFTTKLGGRGLGLAATLGIARSHRGAIWVRSEVDSGTTIRLVVPAIASEARPMVEASPAPTLSSFGGTGPVLVADDEPVVRRLTARALSTAGFDVTECADGQEALEAVAADPARWRLVVLDLSMPRLSGEDALRRMRALRPDLPAVLCSGYTEEALDPELTQLPHVAFLQKPFTMLSLATALQRALGPALSRAEPSPRAR